MVKSKTRKQGESLITTIPKEVSHGMHVGAGENLLWQPVPGGGYHVFAHTPDLEDDMDAFEKARKKVNPVMKALADHDAS